MRSLVSVQKIYKVLKILTLISFIFQVIAAAMAVIGALGLMIFTSSDSLGAIFAQAVVEATGSGIEFTDVGKFNATVTCWVGAMVCAVSAVPTIFLYRYFGHEEYDGTPFTHRGAAELEQVGILYICISLGALLAAGVICAILGVTDVDFTDMVAAGEGIAMILLSKVFKYGADLREPTDLPSNPPTDRV